MLIFEEIWSLFICNINVLVVMIVGLFIVDEGDDVNVCGFCDDVMNYYVDGVCVQGNLILELEIDQLQVIIGGVEVCYGDVMGGIIFIIIKGFFSKFFGGIEVEIFQYFDFYDNSLVGLNFLGLILKNSKGVFVFGFWVVGCYIYCLDDDLLVVFVYWVNDDVLVDLQVNFVILKGGVFFVVVDFFINDDVEVFDVCFFEDCILVNLNVKFDVCFSDVIDVMFSGIYFNGEN